MTWTNFGRRLLYWSPEYPSENILDPDLWVHVFFLAQKCEVQSGIIPPLFFVPILLRVISSLKNSSPEEVVTTHNKHCQDQAYICLSITDTFLRSLGKWVDFSNEDEGASALVLQLSGSKPYFSAAVQGPSLTPLLLLPHRRCPPAYIWHDLGRLSW